MRIIKEKKITPITLELPQQNKDFFEVQQAATTLTNAENPHLMVFMHQKAYLSIWQHIKLDLKNELGGAVIGYYAQSPTGQRFILITDILNQPIEYHTDPTLLRFTTQFYNDLEAYMDFVNLKYPHLLRLGLYHTHPSYGIFMSRTDVNTFKGIFKDKHQIALIADPVQNEDGVFIWEGDEISKKTGYFLYDCQSPDYQPHTAPTNNEFLAKYNFQTTYNGQPMVSLDATQIPANDGQQPQRIIKERLKIGHIPIKKKEPEKLNFTLKDYVPRMCPLFDVHYRNQEVKLYRYFQALKKTVPQNEYTYLIFFKEAIKEKIEECLQVRPANTPLLGILKGRFFYDKLKDIYFIDLYDVVFEEPTEDIFQFKFIEKMVQKHQQIDYDTFGWIAVNPHLTKEVFRYTERHQQVFSHNYNLGILSRPSADNKLDLHNSYFVAYNFDKNAPFDYFKQLFIYKKVL